MFFVLRAREFFSTLRFRIVWWITLIVFAMVIGMNTGVREIEQHALRLGYDEYLVDTVEEIGAAVAGHNLDEKEELYDVLKAKVKDDEYRSLFVQIYDDKKKLVWGSSNGSVTIPPPSFQTEYNGPFNGKRHRVYEKKVSKPDGHDYFIRCGFLQLALEEDIELINRNILWASLFLVVLAPLGGYVIAWRATRPITQVITTATHLQPGNLKERLPIRGTGDEIDRLSHTINGMLDRLASFITQNRDFVANAAHELRSPLAAIRASVAVGLNQSRSQEEYVHILIEVMEEITRLAGLINGLLILAEGDAGRLAARVHASRLDRIVRESVEMFDAVAESAGVHLTVEELALAVVPGDDSNLRQVVRNLIDNAIKYNHNPGEVVVRLTVDSAKKQAVLTVKDSGVGIDPAALPRIFERFYRVDKSRTRETERRGYGLGLSICRTIVEALKGEITAESTFGVGTTMTVRLPLADDLAALSQSGDQHIPLPAAKAVGSH